MMISSEQVVSQDRSDNKDSGICSAVASSEQAAKLVVCDQYKFWTSPLHLRTHDFNWLIPVTAGTGLLMVADPEIETHAAQANAHRWNTLSNAGLAAAFGTAGSLYVLGKTTHDPHAQETGKLSAVAAVNSLVVNSALQRISRRVRPDTAHSGEFFVGGSSFPSDHSGLSWSIATVIANEYPGWATKLLAYGSATAISAARIGARKHFTSDVVVGSALGYFIGRETYRLHHNPDVGGSLSGDFKPSVEHIQNPFRQGSSYVPLDSWVYSAFDRLAALGYAPAGASNLRPWTRLEFARLLEQAELSAPGESDEVRVLYQDLEKEFATERRVLAGEPNIRFGIDSVYTRVTTIGGDPLTDGLHFGQTISNDYGRPYQRGFNSVAGIQSHAEAGPFGFFVRGEYQHSPSAPALSDSTRAAIAAADGLPIAPVSTGDINRFRLLDSYVALNLREWQISFGKQSLWWGPAVGQDLMLSNNAEPIPMLRLTRVKPATLPGPLSLAGQIQTDVFLGKVDGYHLVRLGPNFQLTGTYDHELDPQPYIWGLKLSVQPTRNLHLGMSMTTLFAGFGRPLTFDTWLHTFSSQGNAQSVEPGDRRTGFDFSYKVPGLRNWLVVYSGSVSEDEPSPIAYPRRSAWNPGIYLTQFPGIHKLDLHLEAAYTNLPNDPRSAVFYTNSHYANGYTNNGQIMGGWLGPQSRSYQAWANYWQSGQSKLQFGMREQLVDSSYIGGGRLRDVKASYSFLPRPDVAMNIATQYEHWRFPALSNDAQSNVTFSFRVDYRPRWTAARGSRK